MTCRHKWPTKKEISLNSCAFKYISLQGMDVNLWSKTENHLAQIIIDRAWDWDQVKVRADDPNCVKLLATDIQPHNLHALSDHHTLIIILTSIHNSTCGNELVTHIHQSSLVCIAISYNFCNKYIPKLVLFESNTCNLSTMRGKSIVPHLQHSISLAILTQTWAYDLNSHPALAPLKLQSNLTDSRKICQTITSLIPRGLVSSTLIRLQPGGGRSFPSSLLLASEPLSELSIAFRTGLCVSTAHTPCTPTACFSRPAHNLHKCETRRDICF